jgi:hypothetical protein
VTDATARARQAGLFGGQPLGKLVGLGVAFLRETVEIANDLLVVKLARELTVAFRQVAEELNGFLHDADVPFGSGKLHPSDALSDSVKHGCSDSHDVIRC